MLAPSCEEVFDNWLHTPEDCFWELAKTKGEIKPQTPLFVPDDLLLLCGIKAPLKPKALIEHIEAVSKIEDYQPIWPDSKPDSKDLKEIPQLAQKGVFIGRFAPSYYLVSTSLSKLTKSSKDLSWATAELLAFEPPKVRMEPYQILTSEQYMKELKMQLSENQVEVCKVLKRSVRKAKIKTSPRILGPLDEELSYEFHNRGVLEPLRRLHITLPKIFPSKANEKPLGLPSDDHMEKSRDYEEQMETVESVDHIETKEQVESATAPNATFVAASKEFKIGHIPRFENWRSEALIENNKMVFGKLLEFATERLPWDLNTYDQIHFMSDEQDLLGRVDDDLLNRLGEGYLSAFKYKKGDEEIEKLKRGLEADLRIEALSWMVDRAKSLIKEAEDAKPKKDPQFVDCSESFIWIIRDKVPFKFCIESIWSKEYRNPKWVDDGCGCKGGSDSTATKRNLPKGPSKSVSAAAKPSNTYYMTISDSEDEDLGASSDMDVLDNIHEDDTNRASSRTLREESSSTERDVFPQADWMLSSSAAKRITTSSSDALAKGGERDSSTANSYILVDASPTSSPVATQPSSNTEDIPSRGDELPNRPPRQATQLAKFTPEPDTPLPPFPNAKRKGNVGAGQDDSSKRAKGNTLSDRPKE